MTPRRPLRDDPAADAERIRKMLAEYDELQGPRVGDWVRFADGHEMRIAYLTADGGVQVAYGGTWSMGRSIRDESVGVSFTGQLRKSFPALTLTYEGGPDLGGIVYCVVGPLLEEQWVQVKFAARIYACSLPAPKV
jgi:hypothetical protein